MLDLKDWAATWGVSNAAVYDLMNRLGVAGTPPPKTSDATSETGVQQRVRMDYARNGHLLWRNNVGSLQDAAGRWIRYGLANESKQMNEKIKSSDLIGMTCVVITPEHVGQTLGIFTAIETKKPGWKYKATAHEQAQLKYLELVLSKGGIAGFSTGVDASVKTE